MRQERRRKAPRREIMILMKDFLETQRVVLSLSPSSCGSFNSSTRGESVIRL